MLKAVSHTGVFVKGNYLKVMCRITLWREWGTWFHFKGASSLFSAVWWGPALVGLCSVRCVSPQRLRDTEAAAWEGRWTLSSPSSSRLQHSEVFSLQHSHGLRSIKPCQNRSLQKSHLSCLRLPAWSYTSVRRQQMQGAYREILQKG